VRRAGALLVLLAAAGLGLVLTRGLDRSGRSQLVPTPTAPQRVILFAPNLSETAWALGHGDRIVAVTDYCVWPAELADRPRVGGMVDPNLERILALHPDLLVVQGESGVLADLARHGDLALARVDMDRGLDSILEGFVSVDSLLSGGETGRGRALREEVAAALAAVADSAPPSRPRVLLSLGHDPGALTRLWTAGGGSFLNELLARAGGELRS